MPCKNNAFIPKVFSAGVTGESEGALEAWSDLPVFQSEILMISYKDRGNVEFLQYLDGKFYSVVREDRLFLHSTHLAR